MVTSRQPHFEARRRAEVETDWAAAVKIVEDKGRADLVAQFAPQPGDSVSVVRDKIARMLLSTLPQGKRDKHSK